MASVFKIALIFIVFLFKSCTTSRPVSYEKSLSNDNESQALISDYLEAIDLAKSGKSSKACKILTDLQGNENFHQQSLLFIKTLSTCEYLPIELSKIWDQNQYLPEWIMESYIKTSLKLANEHSMDSYIAKFSFMSVKYQKLQKDKIKLLKSSIELAKKNNLTDRLKIFKKALENVAPRFTKKITKENIYKVARDFESIREFKKARKLYSVIMKRRSYSVHAKYKAYNRYRLSYKNERDMKNYLLYTKKMYHTFSKNNFYKKYKVKTAITYARAVWTDHKRGKARAVLKKIQRDNKLSNDNQSLIYWLLGSMKLEQAMESPKRKVHFQNQAIWNFKKANSYNPSNEYMSDKIKWAISFTYYLKRDFKTSYTLFSKYKNSTKSDSFKSKFSFWEAKSLYSLKEFDESEKLFKELSEKDPFSYYGIIATKESKNQYSPIKVKGNLKATTLPHFEWLFSLKERELAIKYLSYEKRKLRRSNKLKGLLPLYYRSNAYDKMIHLYFSLNDTEKKEILHSSPHFVYPRPFLNKVVTAEKKSGVDRNLILSISRQESAFNPLARSHADAFGVMQLLPERGRSVASEHKIPFDDFYDLFKPETNIMLGAILLSKLQKSFSNKFPLYVASYNASSNAVRRWYKDRYKGDFIKFIEMIPYAETQKYVKLVLRNYFIYKRLNSTESFLWNPELFNKVDA